MQARRSRSCHGLLRRGRQVVGIGEADGQGRPTSAAFRHRARRRHDRSGSARDRRRLPSNPWCRPACRRRESAVPGSGDKSVEHDPHRSGARGAAMLHPRHHFLADIAALVEIDAVQAVHVGFVRKRVAIDEVEAAARNARGNAMRVIGRAVDQLGADQIGDLLREFLAAPGSASRAPRCADRRRPDRASWRARRPRPPSRRGCRRGFRPQPWRAACRSRACRRAPCASARGQSIRKPPPWPAGRFGDQEIDRDLALRRQQARRTGRGPGRSSVTSVVTRPLRKLRASSPLTLTTPRSGRNAAFMMSFGLAGIAA